ncbi:MAG: hypothetical protein IPF60_00285 [Betaproteobacteria bacterium]|nr:hypothetical protein [Betaproteobacteria bacterium]
MPTPTPVPDSELANAVRALAMDAVETARSGHPGMPMGMADIAVALWNRHLRLIPNLDVWRPCDTVETAVAWAAAIERRDGPTALVLTRQNVPCQSRDQAAQAAIRRGGYVLADWPADTAAKRAVVIATGSEVALAQAARESLRGEGIAVRVVSMPCTDVCDRQDPPWRAAVLPPGIARVAVEAGATDGWRRYVGAADDPRAGVVGLDRFGESAPAAALFQHFGITAEGVVAAVRRVVG